MVVISSTPSLFANIGLQSPEKAGKISAELRTPHDCLREIVTKASEAATKGTQEDGEGETRVDDDQEKLVKAGAEAFLKPFADLLNRLAGPAAEELGLTLGDTLHFWRMQRRFRLLQRTQEMIEKAGITPGRVPLKILLPIVGNAEIEDDDDLQDRWAALLTNSATGRNVTTVFVELLRQLSAADACLLKACFTEAFNSYNRFSPPWHSGVDLSVNDWMAKDRERWYGDVPGTYPWSDLSVENLIRLGLLICTESIHVPGRDEDHYKLSYLGYHFMLACEDPSVIREMEFKRPRG